MSQTFHLGQYWSSRHREIRLFLSTDARLDGGRNRGTARDVTLSAADLLGARRQFRRLHEGTAWNAVRFSYRALATPVVELIERLDADGQEVDDWASRALAAASGDVLSIEALDCAPAIDADHLVAPVIPRRAQAFGVTYLNSALERETEGTRGDYGYVYRSVKERGERPELFLKGTASEHFVGPNGLMGLRHDLTNSVDRTGNAVERTQVLSGIEPELAAVVRSDGRIWGYTLADDVSGNRIENESLLYLYQAKHFTGGLVLGPLILLSREQENPRVDITARIRDPQGRVLFEKSTNSSRINAPLGCLVAWARSHLLLQPAELFSTGTDMVPDGAVKVLSPGMTVEIASPAIGILRHGAGMVREGALLNADYDRWEFEGV